MPINTTQVANVIMSDTFTQFANKTNEVITIVNGLPSTTFGAITRSGGTIDGGVTGNILTGGLGDLFIINEGRLGIGDYLATGQPKLPTGQLSILKALVPASLLVQGTSASINVASSSPAGYANLHLWGPANDGGTALHFLESGGATGAGMIFYYDGLTNKLHIKDLTGGVETDRFTFTRPGELGIGTTTPGYRLQVEGSGTESISVKTTGTDGEAAVYRWHAGGHNWALSMSQASEDLILWSASSPRVKFTKDGKVGIGTQDPKAPLHIFTDPYSTDVDYGTGKGSLMIGDEADQNLIIDVNEIMARSGSDDPDPANLHIQRDGGDLYLAEEYDSPTAAIAAVRVGNTRPGDSGRVATFVNSSHRVGININIPTKTLDVDGDFRATGAATLVGGVTGGLAITGATTVSTTLGVTGLTTLSGGLTVASSGVTSLTGTLGVTGLTTLNDDVSITTNKTLTVGTGLVDLGGALTVDGATTLNDDVSIASNKDLSLSGSGTLTVGSGATTLGGTLALTGDMTTDLVITDSSGASSDTTGALKVTGGISTRENLYVGTNLDVTGLSTLDGLTTLGAGLTVSSGLTTVGTLKIGGHLTDSTTVGGGTTGVSGEVLTRGTNGPVWLTPSPIKGAISGLTISKINATDFQISPGSATSADGTRILTLDGTITKKVTDAVDPGGWVAGTNQRARPPNSGTNNVPLADDTWYHVFIINKVGINTDIGIDTNIAATNLLADSEFDHARYIGSILHVDATDGIHNFYQIGDHFSYETGFEVSGAAGAISPRNPAIDILSVGGVHNALESEKCGSPPDVRCQVTGYLYTSNPDGEHTGTVYMWWGTDAYGEDPSSFGNPNTTGPGAYKLAMSDNQAYAAEITFISTLNGEIQWRTSSSTGTTIQLHKRYFFPHHYINYRGGR